MAHILRAIGVAGALVLLPAVAAAQSSVAEAVFRCAFDSGDAALRACDQVLRAELPAEVHAQAYHNRGVELGRLGSHEEADDAHRETLRLAPEAGSAWMNLGFELTRLGRWEDALRAYDQAVRLQPDSADAHYSRGAALVGLGRWPAALMSFREASRLAPDDPEVHYNIGLVQNAL